ncbi:MAG: hypothetical protein RSD57_13680 [Comamonas sp.]
MLALEPLIVARLQQHFAALGPAVKLDAKGWSDEGDRKVLPNRVAVLVRFAGTPQGAVTKVAAAITTGWAIELRAKRGAKAAELLDSAFAEVLQALHEWVPAPVAGRKWSHLAYQNTDPADLIDDGVFGLSMYFQTAAIYPGKR